MEDYAEMSEVLTFTSTGTKFSVVIEILSNHSAMNNGTNTVFYVRAELVSNAADDSSFIHIHPQETAVNVIQNLGKMFYLPSAFL